MRAGWILAATVVAVGVGGYLLVASGRAPPKMTQTLQAVASSAAALASAYVPTVAGVGPDPADAAPEAAPPPHKQSGRLSNTQLGAPLVHGTFISECGAPDAMHVSLKVTVRAGHAVAVDVKTTPPDATIAACIEGAVRAKQWDISPKTDHVTVNY